jgi:hypothetical protein
MHGHFHQRALGMGAGRSRRPNYRTRVFYTSWCEWTPLAGLMTFLAEAVDLPRQKVVSGCGSIRRYSNHQLFVRNHLSILSQLHRVGICMTLSGPIWGFPRVWIKRQVLAATGELP